MSLPTMPPLPKPYDGMLPDIREAELGITLVDGFSAEQVQAYARAYALLVVEECAKVADQEAEADRNPRYIGAAIRARFTSPVEER